jgi:four helix bundle protein
LKSHKDLTAWQKAMDFVELIYKITGDFPESEKFGLTSQLRIAACLPKAGK